MQHGNIHKAWGWNPVLHKEDMLVHTWNPRTQAIENEEDQKFKVFLSQSEFMFDIMESCWVFL